MKKVKNQCKNVLKNVNLGDKKSQTSVKMTQNVNLDEKSLKLVQKSNKNVNL